MKPTQDQIERAATEWCRTLDREMPVIDRRHFRNYWQQFDGLKAFVEREVAADRRTDVAKAVWECLGSDFTFEEATSREDEKDHREAVKWVYKVADAAIAAMDAKP